MNLSIRCETPADFSALSAFIKTAFETAKVSEGTESDFVDQLRAGSGYLPDLALVAEEQGALVGHIMLTRTHIERDGGADPFPVLLLAPLSVLLARRSCGIGATLVREAFARAKAQGHKAILLVGDPAYYEQFGFRPSTDFGVENTNGIPAHNVMLCELEAGALSGLRGRISFFKP